MIVLRYNHGQAKKRIKMEKVQKKFYLPREVAEDIKEQAKAKGVPESYYVQEAVKKQIKRDKK